MNTRSVLTVALAGCLLVSCIPSVNPYYRPGDRHFDPALLGEWIDGDEHWTFSSYPDDELAYRLSYADGQASGQVKATLFRLGDEQFIDVIAEDFELADGEWELVAASLFPGHLVLHVESIQPRLTMALIDVDWLGDYLENDPGALSHRIADDRILLTGTTRELQRFLRKHLDGGELFSDYTEFARSAASR